MPPASAGGKKERLPLPSRLQPDFPALLQHFVPPSRLSRMNPLREARLKPDHGFNPILHPPAEAGGKEEPARSRLRNSPSLMHSSELRPLRMIALRLRAIMVIPSIVAFGLTQSCLCLPSNMFSGPFRFFREPSRSLSLRRQSHLQGEAHKIPRPERVMQVRVPLPVPGRKVEVKSRNSEL